MSPAQRKKGAAAKTAAKKLAGRTKPKSTAVSTPRKKKKKPDTNYTPARAKKLASLIASGKSLINACAENSDLPVYQTWIGWASDLDHPWSDLYARACLLRAMVWAEEIITITDNTAGDFFIESIPPQAISGNEKDGFKINFNLLKIKADHYHIHRAKLMADKRQWMLSKLIPKTFGDKVDLSHSGRMKIRIEYGEEDEMPLAEDQE